MEKQFIPALKYSVLTPYIDWFLDVFMKGPYLRNKLAENISNTSGNSVLDFACGTGAIAFLLKDRISSASVTGIDIDNDVIRLAEIANERRTSDRRVKFVTYDGYRLPFEDCSFDVVLSSMAFHHLLRNEKIFYVDEIFRVLRNNGVFYLLDFGKQDQIYHRMVTNFLKRIEPLEDNLNDFLFELLKRSQFMSVEKVWQVGSFLGSVTLYSAKKR
jgi:ubiquinone/menaquinone biosynthesis C-methylase UbiE